MTLRRWIHLASLLIPVGILTVFNVLGIEAGAPLIAALSALTTGGVAAGPGQTGQAGEERTPKSAKRRAPPTGRRKATTHATRNAVQDSHQLQSGAPARAVGTRHDGAGDADAG